MNADLPPGTDEIIRSALREDLGSAGDITTNSVVPDTAQAVGDLVVRRGGRIAGLAVALRVFSLVDEAIGADVSVQDGTDAGPGAVLATVRGPARGILTAERVALNLLARMTGVATATADLVARVDGTGAAITDTRKTTPGLRTLERYAVRLGGGVNHRFGLFDAVLIKDNHLAVAGSVAEAVLRARRAVGADVRVQVETDTTDQVAPAVAAGADAILLDNMTVGELRRAVEIVAGRCITEASGGVVAGTVRAIAETGVDVISVGALTHSAPAADIALDFQTSD